MSFAKITSKPAKIMVKVLIVLLVVCILGGIYALGVNAYIKSASAKRILSPEEAADLGDVDCVLVLGAGVHGETLSHMLEDRVLTGIDLYNAGASKKILMSGDHGRTDYDEVNSMKKYAKEKGVPSEDIFMDHAGFSTYESMYRAKEIFGAKKIIIITQKYHLYRAIYIAKALGIDAYGVDSQRRPYAIDTNVYNTLREFLARNKDFIYVKFRPKPTYLGEPIPISGNGDITNDKT